MAISLRTCNVRGIAGTSKRLAIFKYFKEEPHDITLIQETHSTPQTQQTWETNWPGKILLSHGTNKIAGVGFLLNKSVEYENYVEVVPCLDYES